MRSTSLPEELYKSLAVSTTVVLAGPGDAFTTRVDLSLELLVAVISLEVICVSNTVDLVDPDTGALSALESSALNTFCTCSFVCPSAEEGWLSTPEMNTMTK